VTVYNITFTGGAGGTISVGDLVTYDASSELSADGIITALTGTASAGTLTGQFTEGPPNLGYSTLIFGGPGAWTATMTSYEEASGPVTGTLAVTSGPATSSATGYPGAGDRAGTVTVSVQWAQLTSAVKWAAVSSAVTTERNPHMRTTAADIGDRPVITTTWRDAITDALTSPTVVAYTVRAPNGTSTTYTSPNGAIDLAVSVGVTRFTFPTVLDQAGVWAWRVVGTAGVQAAEQGTLTVQALA